MKTFLPIIFIFKCLAIIGQQPDTCKSIVNADSSNIEKIYENSECDERAAFPGGSIQLLKYITENIRYPNTEPDIEGTVYIKFVITKTGEIGQTNVLRSVDPLLDEEALRVVKSLPKWEPAKINEVRVNSWFIIPVNFKLL